ncbi:kynureninase [Brevibacterium litoralis]|uniref:kynureninase n=1 Tax=Brevibacterium litoralis TaxID=3138935 RepID=UPI0032EFC699
MTTDADLLARARALDSGDPLAPYRDRFAPAPGVEAYLDGNSLGRPLRRTSEDLDRLVSGAWGTGLIRSWDAGWMDLPLTLGDRIGRVCLGAATGQTVVADSTTVLLYKLVRAAVAARPDRTEIVIETANFPTDRFVVEGIAAETGRTVRWLEADPVHGVGVDDLAGVVTEDTALVVLGHVDYRSAAVADMAALTAAVHAQGALVLWDLCHSVGVVSLDLDACGVDLAVGCTYKYLNGGPGAPAFAYVAAVHQGRLRQPVQGWMGARDVFGMRETYEPAEDLRQFISGTPPVLAMTPMAGMLDLLEDAGMPVVQEKARSLTDLVVEVFDARMAPVGARLASPREAARRGGHVTVVHPGARAAVSRLWEAGVVPDFRSPDGIRLGLSPLSTSHVEAVEGALAVARELAAG